MISGNEIEEIRIDPESGRWVSRTELIALEGVTERTITNRIKSGYYKSRLTPEGNREIFLSRKTLPEMLPETFQKPAGNVTGSPEVDPETLPDHDRKPKEDDPETTLAVAEVIGKAQDRIDHYVGELLKAREERGYYRAITDTHTKNEQTLRDEIFELSAKIKELEAQPKADDLQKALQEAEEKHAQELQTKDNEINALKAQLEAERKKGFFPWFKR